MPRSINWKTVQSLLRDERTKFLLVGAFNTAFGYIVFVIVNLTIGRDLVRQLDVALASIVSLLLSHFISSIPAFFLYRIFVFKASGPILRDFARFQSVYFVPITANIFALPFLVWIGVNTLLAQGLITVTNVVVTYLGHKFFTFRRRSDVNPGTLDI